MANREKMIECLVDNYKSKLIELSNWKIAKEVFNIMNCKNCPLHTQDKDVDVYDCVKERLKESKEEVKLIEIAIEALKNQEAERERIVKKLEEATEIGANDFGQFECIPKWEAIEIVRGGKE